MRKHESDSARRLIPDAPPQRLPEETLLSQLKQDKAYRRNASLLRSLLYRPQRLFTSGAPSRLPPAISLRELRYRLVAVATSLALLIGMVSFAPFDFLSLAGSSQAATTDASEDYSWLVDGAGTESNPYKISTPAQLSGVAMVVAGLAPAGTVALGRSASVAPTMEVVIGGYTFVIGPEEENILPPGFQSPLAPPSVATPVETPAPTPVETPTATPTEAPTPEPTVAPTLVPSESPTPSATPDPEPSVTPPVESAVSPSETSPEVSSEAIPVPLSLTLDIPESTPESTPEPSPEVSPEPSPTTSPEVSPSPSASVSPSESTSPAESVTPSVSVTPSEGVTPSESATPTPTPTVTATSTPTVVPMPTHTMGNSEALGNGVQPATYSLTVPSGLKGKYIVLTSDINLYAYSGATSGGARLYWTPIGILGALTNNGVPSGSAPFEGSFDGASHTVYGFHYAPNPSYIDPTVGGSTALSMVGYGLFGYVGSSGTVKNLTVRTNTAADGTGAAIPWVLSNYLSGDSSVTMPLGKRNYAVGVVAGASSGTLSGCTVAQAELGYTFTPSAVSLTAVGGVAGTVSGGKLENCTFLGKLSNSYVAPTGNAAAALQGVGGIAGYLVGSAATMTQCAAGVDMDVYNSASLGRAEGVGGLFGYGAVPITLTRCFTTGTVRAWHDAGGLAGRSNGKTLVTDSFSTVAVGRATSMTNTLDATLTTTVGFDERMGGLFGALGGTGTALTNVYFAGSLLEPQFGAITSRLQSAPVFTNVAIDATQVPHGPFKDPGNSAGLTVARSLDGFSGWTAAAGHTPSPTFTAPSAALTALASSATLQWAKVTESNTVADTTGNRNLYQLTDGALDGSLFSDATRALTYSDSNNNPIGGEYLHIEKLDNTPIPMRRSAITAVNQAAGMATTISSGDTLLRFVNRVNSAPGGFLGSVYTFADGNVMATGSVIPAYARDSVKTFWGTLRGGANSVISGFSYGKDATGILDTACYATVENFTLNNSTTTNLSLATPSKAKDQVYFGFAVGQLFFTDLTNVDAKDLTYTYTGTSADTNYKDRYINIGLVGLLPKQNTRLTSIKNCDVSGLKIAISSGPNDVMIRAGSLLGTNLSPASFEISNCTVSAAISLDAASNSNSSGEFLPYAGGLVGFDNESTINAKITNSHVDATISAARAGGLVGRVRLADISRSTFTGSVSTSSRFVNTSSPVSFASGGLVGAADHISGILNINECAALGNIDSSYYAGGLVGYAQGSMTIQNSYASGVVTSPRLSSATGGLVGYLTTTGNFENSYFTGQASSAGDAGAILGKALDTATLKFNSVFFDTTLLPAGTVAYNGGKVDAANQSVQGARPDEAGTWDSLPTKAPTVWRDTAADHRYPSLIWLDSALPTRSLLTTQQLFRAENPTLDTVYAVSILDTVDTILPTGQISSTPAPGGFLTQNEQTDAAGITTTRYKLHADIATDGKLNFTYTNLAVDGKDLTIPYNVGIKLFDVGSGKADDPYIIYNLDQLLVFRAFIDTARNTPSIHYKISTKDGTTPITIDMAHDLDGTTPLDWGATESALTGHLDGFGSTLENFYSTGRTDPETGVWTAGLLGGLAAGSTVKNLTILGPENGSPAIVGSAISGNVSHAAGLLSATAAGGTVSGVTVKGGLRVDCDVSVGGLIGKVSTAGNLTLSQIISDVDIAGSSGGGDSTTGAGPILGTVINQTKALQALTLSECAAYGSVEHWRNVGGLIGYVDSALLAMDITDSFSLANLLGTGAGSSGYGGGMVGYISNVDGNDGRHAIIKTSYYGGDATTLGGTVAGMVGGADAKSATSAMAYVLLSIQNSPHNSETIAATVANLYYNGGYNGRYDWPNSWVDSPHVGEPSFDSNHPDHSNPIYKPDAGKNYGTAYYSPFGSSFGMSQGEDKRYDYMKPWSLSVWKFDDGLYPRLRFEPQNDGDLTLKHLAIHYTKAGGSNDSYANVFVRYTGATLSVPSDSPLRVTENQRMAVAVKNPATTATVPITIRIGAGTRTIHIVPSVESTGSRDVSIYYANPTGMWPSENGGKKVWEVYTADALAGLSTLFSEDDLDQNELENPKSTVLAGGTVRLGRDINLGDSYHGMSSSSTWRPIGNVDYPFNVTLDGGGHTLYDLALNPFVQTSLADHYTDLTTAPLGLFGYIDGGTVQNLVLAGAVPNIGTAEKPISVPAYRQPGIRVGLGITAAGTLAATAQNATFENCLVTLPVYTMGDIPKLSAGDDWSAVPYLGAAAGVPMGGLVGKVTGTTTITNCAYTGYVYADAKNPRPGSDLPTLPDATGGSVGGLVGTVAIGAALTVTDSYAAGYVHGTQTGALVGSNAGTITLSGVSYDQNAAGGAATVVGSESGTTSGTATPQVPSIIGENWQSDTPDGLYPLQSALSAYPGTLSGRIRISLTPHAGSATAGVMSYTQNSAALVYDSALQPGVAAVPGSVAVTDASFTKLTDGLAQLELRQDGSSRRVLVNLRCWYNDATLVGDVRHYTISTAEELWELSQIVNGTIGDSASSKVAHTHTTLNGANEGYDDFANSVVELAGDIDLSTLTDLTGAGDTVLRSWRPIGSANAFAGTLEGKGHAVSGMGFYSDAGTPATASRAGLFDTVSGTVQNLLVSNSTLTSNGVGGLICVELSATGSLISCGSSGAFTASGNGSSIGGLAGVSEGTIQGCFSTAELYASGGTAGGLVGTLKGGAVIRSYFTGLISAPTAATVGGVAGDQQSGRVGECYVSAYLDGQSTYHISKSPDSDCVYDSRHTSKGIGGTAQNGAALTMPTGSWVADPSGKYYPVPYFFSVSMPDGTSMADTALGKAAKTAAVIFTFSSSSGGSNFSRFSMVTAPSLADGGRFLRSGDAALLSIRGNEAWSVSESNGSVVLRLCQGTSGQSAFQRPCWLVIPAVLAVTYRINWDDFINSAKLNEKYNTTVTTGGSATLIRTTADWQAFVTLANQGASSTRGKTFVLDHDLDFGGGVIPTVTAPFAGAFNGGGHTISNFTSAAPLFSVVEQGASVQFLALNRGSLALTGSGVNPLSVGLVAGVNRGRIANVAADHCSVSFTCTLSTAVETAVGGLVGTNENTMDSCYFYATSSSSTASQVTARYPHGAKPTGLRMAGLAGLNASSGSIVGCYAAFTPICYLGDIFNGPDNINYYAALAGLNDGGSIRNSYWRFAYDHSASEGISLVSYRNSGADPVPGVRLFAGGTDATSLELTARWLSADSYGGAYYVDGNRLMLHNFKLIKYDLSEAFGSSAEQHLMLSLQFGAGDNAMSSNAVCSWKDYLLPNFANLPVTATLNVRVPMLSSKLSYSLPTVYAITQNMADLSAMKTAGVSGSALGGYTVTPPNFTTRVFLDVKLISGQRDIPWGVYRKDTTLPREISE